MPSLFVNLRHTETHSLNEYLTEWKMVNDIQSLIGEATAYDKKLQLETKRPKSWLKSVSAFANGEGGTLVFGISDDNRVVGLDDAERDAERISEEVKTKLDPVPAVNLEFKEADGKRLVLLHVYKGQETPYYYVGDKQRLAYVRVGNESVVADRLQLKSLVMRGGGHSFDTMPSRYKFENLAFTKLKAVHYQKLRTSFTDSDFVSWGLVDDDGRVTNAAALIADESPVRQSRIFCTRWNGLDMTNGLGEAYDDAELSGSVINMLQDAVAFVRNNSHKKWWKEADHREERPDYPERAVVEAITNAIIHRDYMELGSEIHIDMYDDRMEIYSPGGMMDGKQIQNLDPLHVPSKRRNPLLADCFNRLDLMERRGSGMKKIVNAYRMYEQMPTYRAPEFKSYATEFYVVLWNLNYGIETVRDGFENEKQFPKDGEQFPKQFPKDGGRFPKGAEQFPKEFPKGGKEFPKELIDEFPKEFRKEFLAAQRGIYRLISVNPQITIVGMAKRLGVSDRQIKKYLQRLTEMKLIERQGGRKNGCWKITDLEYAKIFEKQDGLSQ